MVIRLGHTIQTHMYMMILRAAHTHTVLQWQTGYNTDAHTGIL